MGSLENSSGVTGKIPPKPINNLSIIYQEPTNNTREEIFVESSDSPKNLSDQKVIYEENRDIEEALSEIPFPESEFETTASVVGIEDSQEVTENAKASTPKIGVHDLQKSGCNKEYKGKEQGIEGNKYTREQQPAKDESVAAAPDYLPFDDELLDEIPFPEDELFDDLAPIPTETKVEGKPKQKRATKPKEPTDKLQKPEGVADTVWADWLKHKKRKSGKATQYVVNALKREADKVPMTLEQAMVYQLEQGWTGFKAEWVNNKQNSRPAWKRPSPFDDISHVDSWDEDLNS